MNIECWGFLRFDLNIAMLRLGTFSGSRKILHRIARVLDFPKFKGVSLGSDRANRTNFC